LHTIQRDNHHPTSKEFNRHPFTLKKYLKAKEEEEEEEEELWKLKYFTMQKTQYSPKKKSSIRNQNPSRY
jgi:hypothetical protein